MSSSPSQPVRPIFCGTDFSPNAERASRAAAVFARLGGKPLVLAHVSDEFGEYGHTQAHAEAFEHAVRLKLEEEARQLATGGAKVEPLLLPTSGHMVEHAMMKGLKERDPALVVVSSVSKTGFDRWSLGSVSEHLARNASAPTLVVRSSEPLEAWAAGERPLRLFVAADFGAVADAAILWAGQLRRFGPCEIVVAYVDRPHKEWERLGLDCEVAYTKNPPQLQEALERDLREKARVVLGEVDVTVVVEPVADRPDARLIELASEHKADIVVVGTHQRPLLKRLWKPSVSLGILRHAPMNVVCVPGVAIPLTERPLPEVRRLMVASDFSELSIRAIHYGISVAPEGSTVIFVHVIPPVRLPDLLPLPDPAESPEASTERRHEAMVALEQKLRALIPPAEYRPELGRAPTLHYEVHVVEHDDIPKALGMAADRYGADLLCIGAHGRSALASALIGSVAREVMIHSRRPVLFVPPPLQ